LAIAEVAAVASPVHFRAFSPNNNNSGHPGPGLVQYEPTRRQLHDQNTEATDVLKEKRIAKPKPVRTAGRGGRRNFLPFEEARKLAHTLPAQCQRDWKRLCRTGGRPACIPARPDLAFKNAGWVSWGHWLGTGTQYTREKGRNMLSFEEARAFVRGLHLQGQKEWYLWSRTDERPDNIPSRPDLNYRGKGWISYGDWLGTESTGTGVPNPKSRKKTATRAPGSETTVSGSEDAVMASDDESPRACMSPILEKSS
jgi:hypothetical protein